MQKCFRIRFALGVASLFALSSLTGCSGRPVDRDEPAEHSDQASTPAKPQEKELSVEQLSAALSRAQTRIEELDAKVASLTDKLEATKTTLDNITGAKPIQTQVVGSAHQIVPEESQGKDTPVKGAEAKALIRMDSAIGDFSKAMALMKSGKYTEAVLAFNRFTESYPEHVLAGSAQYQAGEAYFQLKEYKLALNEFGKVVSSFAASPRVSSSMVRMAHCYAALGNANEASRTLVLARDMFEGSPALDLSAPAVNESKTAGTATASAQDIEKKAKELSAGPIEPAEPPKKPAESEHKGH